MAVNSHDQYVTTPLDESLSLATPFKGCGLRSYQYRAWSKPRGVDKMTTGSSGTQDEEIRKVAMESRSHISINSCSRIRLFVTQEVVVA